MTGRQKGGKFESKLEKRTYFSTTELKNLKSNTYNKTNLIIRVVKQINYCETCNGTCKVWTTVHAPITPKSKEKAY